MRKKTDLKSITKSSGLPIKGEPEYILIGKLQRPHGVTGEIVFGVRTDFPERIKPGNIVNLGSDYQPMKITNTRSFHHDLLVMFEGVNNREDAALLTNLDVFTLTKNLPILEDGLYYHHQLLGLQVFNENGDLLGVVQDILVTGANDVYVVANPEGSEILLPALDSVILKIDLENARMNVKPPNWE